MEEEALEGRSQKLTPGAVRKEVQLAHAPAIQPVSFPSLHVGKIG